MGGGGDPSYDTSGPSVFPVCFWTQPTECQFPTGIITFSKREVYANITWRTLGFWWCRSVPKTPRGQERHWWQLQLFARSLSLYRSVTLESLWDRNRQCQTNKRCPHANRGMPPLWPRSAAPASLWGLRKTCWVATEIPKSVSQPKWVAPTICTKRAGKTEYFGCAQQRESQPAFQGRSCKRTDSENPTGIPKTKTTTTTT